MAIAAVVVVGAVAVRFATHTEPSHPNVVSGRAGLKHTKKGQIERWWHERVTLTVDGSFGTLAPGAVDAVQEAFGAWISSDAKLPRLVFDSRATKKVALAPDGENRIYYAPIQVPGHEGDLAITLGYSNDDTGEIVEADVIINSLRPFALLEPAPSATGSGSSTGTKSGKEDDSSDHGSATGKSRSALAGSGAAAPGCADTYDLKSVVTHEAGHFFGLGEDMTDTSATMYYSTRPCDLGKRELKTDDASQVTALYVASEGAGDEPASAQKCSVGTLGSSRTGSSSTPIVALGLLAAAAVRRRRTSG